MSATLSHVSPKDLKAHSLPEDPAWVGRMTCRHAVAIKGPLHAKNLPEVVRCLEKYGEHRGMVRNGELVAEFYDFGRCVCITSQFAIVDLSKFVHETERLARGKESERIRRLPWWRRLFMPRETGP